MRFDGSSFVGFDLFNPTKQQLQHGPQSKATLGECVFNTSRDFCVDFSVNQALQSKILQTPTQSGGGYVQSPLEFIETNRFCLVQEMIQDVKHVGFAKEVDELSPFGLKANGALLGVWLHGDTKSLPYINNPVSVWIPRSLQRNFLPLIGV